MEIKSGSRDFGNVDHQLIFADPKQTDAKDVSKSSNNENRSARNSGVSADDTTNVLCQLLKQQAAPDVEIDTFDGNPLNYFYFMALFKEAVEKKNDDPKGRLTRRIKFTSGEAKKLIQHCIQLPDLIGYKQAISLMERRYGNPHTIVAAYRREFKKWPFITLGDSAALKRFYSFLIKCQSITADITWNALHIPDTLYNLLAKLPGNMKDIWNRLAYNPRRHEDRDVEFADLENFTEKETILITDPIFSRDALDSFMDKVQRSDHRKRQVKTYATKTDITEEEGKCQSPCHMCKKNHDMDKLKKFLELSVNERSRYFAKNKLCFGCYDLK